MIRVLLPTCVHLCVGRFHSQSAKQQTPCWIGARVNNLPLRAASQRLWYANAPFAPSSSDVPQHCISDSILLFDGYVPEVCFEAGGKYLPQGWFPKHLTVCISNVGEAGFESILSPHPIRI